MKLAERKLMCGKAIKLLMRTRGANLVFQNIYDTGTRSVKCYLNSIDDVSALRDQITDLANMFNLDVRFNVTKRQLYTSPAFIAKL
jgi:hypothetical protein